MSRLTASGHPQSQGIEEKPSLKFVWILDALATWMGDLGNLDSPQLEEEISKIVAELPEEVKNLEEIGPLAKQLVQGAEQYILRKEDLPYDAVLEMDGRVSDLVSAPLFRSENLPSLSHHIIALAARNLAEKLGVSIRAAIMISEIFVHALLARAGKQRGWEILSTRTKDTQVESHLTITEIDHYARTGNLSSAQMVHVSECPVCQAALASRRLPKSDPWFDPVQWKRALSLAKFSVVD
jgi:hypothetical protein